MNFFSLKIKEDENKKLGTHLLLMMFTEKNESAVEEETSWKYFGKFF